MGRTLPTPENILKTAVNITRFGGLNTDEKRRIIAFDLPSPERAAKNPNLTCGVWSEWMHNLQADEVKAPEGHIVRERKWFGNYICLGEEDAIREHRFDAANCPACAYAGQAEEFVPARYHALHVIEYATRAGTYDLLKPFSVRVLPWRVSERQLKQIADLWKEYNDLQIKDLLIKCTAKQYQNYEIQVAATSAWLDPHNNPNLKPGQVDLSNLRDLVFQTYNENRLTDPELASVIATRVGAATLREKAGQLARELGVGSTTGVAVPNQAQPTMSPDDIAAMLSNPSPGVATDQAAQVDQILNPQGTESPQEPAVSPDDLGAAPAPQTSPEPAPAQEPAIPDTAPASDPANAPAPVAPGDDIPTPQPTQQVSLDDLLAG